MLTAAIGDPPANEYALGRADTMNSQRREDALIAPLFPISTLSFPIFYPVIPAKAGIQTVAIKPDTRNQVRISIASSP